MGHARSVKYCTRTRTLSCVYSADEKCGIMPCWWRISRSYNDACMQILAHSGNVGRSTSPWSSLVVLCCILGRRSLLLCAPHPASMEGVISGGKYVTLALHAKHVFTFQILLRTYIYKYLYTGVYICTNNIFPLLFNFAFLVSPGTFLSSQMPSTLHAQTLTQLTSAQYK